MTSTLSKRFLKTVSFIFSIGLWLHLVSSQEMTIYKDVDLIYEIPTGMAISSEHFEELSIKIKGPKAIVRNLETKKMKMKVKINQLKRVSKDKYKMLVDVNNIKVPFGVGIIDYFPKEQEINFEKKSIKKIPLKLGKIKGSNNIKFIHQSLNPKEITIEGPKSLIKNIWSIKVNPFSVDSSVKNGKVNVSLVWPDSRVKWNKEEIFFSYISEIKDNKKTLSDIPITFTTNNRLFDASANKVEIVYVSEDKVDLEKVKISADLTKIDDHEQHEIDLKVNLPEEIQMIKITPKTIKVRLK